MSSGRDKRIRILFSVSNGLLVTLWVLLSQGSGASTTLAANRDNTRDYRTTHPQTLAQTQPRSMSPQVVDQLLGQWQTQDPTTQEQVTLIFAPEHKLFFILPANDGTPVAIETTYQIHTNTVPMQLDMAVTPDQTAFTIFELTPDGKLHLELNGITPGQSRPTAFSENASLFDKLSDETTVPDTIQVVKLQRQGSASGATIASQYITLLNQAQQAYYLENGKFAANLEELKIITTLETESYRYDIVPVGDRTQSVAITAQPKDSNLPSYIGAVFAMKMAGKTHTIMGICQSEQPSTTPPPMPMPPVANSSDIQCPTGSRSLH